MTSASDRAELLDGKTSRNAFQEEVAGRFGVLPNFFQTAAGAPGLIEHLWGFAKSAYLDNPLPSLFKERLFVHLSRFCPVRYCIVRHVGFLVGLGRPAGDPDAPPHTVEQVVALMRRPGILEGAELEAVLSRLESQNAPLEIPPPESQAEYDIFAAASVVFLEPARARRAREALRKAIGERDLEFLLAYLAFIRTAHYWTLTHPELHYEEDMDALLRNHEELAALLLDDQEGERCEMGQRLYDELVLLRQERDDRAQLRAALEEKERFQKHQQLLINELNHRVKNTLAIVQSLASQTLRGLDVPADVRETFTARLVALARAHDLLTDQNWEGADLQTMIGQIVGLHQPDDNSGRIRLDGPLVQLAPKTAVAIAMAVHELATNAVKYGSLSNDTGRVDVTWKVTEDGAGKRLYFSWRESGGPEVGQPNSKGFGTRLIERGLSLELGGEAKILFQPEGAVCTIDAPLPNSGLGDGIKP